MRLHLTLHATMNDMCTGEKAWSWQCASHSNNPDLLILWYCVTGRGLGKLVLPKNIRINHHIYPELLCDFPPDSFELTKASISLYDGVSSHTAKSVALWLEDCMVPFIKDQPDKSPDLNPIKNLQLIIMKDLLVKDISSGPKLEAVILIPGKITHMTYSRYLFCHFLDVLSL